MSNNMKILSNSVKKEILNQLLILQQIHKFIYHYLVVQ